MPRPIASSQAPAFVVCPITVPSDHPASYLGLSALRVLSVNHHHATMEELERRALNHDRSAELRADLAKRGIHSVVLVTCNRAELYWQARNEEDDALAEAAFGISARSCSGTGQHGQVDRAHGQKAALHLLRVASGLESMMLGEHEVMTQVRTAIDAAERDSHAGTLLSGAFAAALRCGGRARAETAISQGAMSVASSGIQRVKSDHDLTRMRALVLGAGQTALKVARHLVSEGVERLTIANRTFEHAGSIAASLNANAAPLDELPRLLAEADLVFVALHSPSFLLDAECLVPMTRAERPLVIVDLSMPRAVDPDVRLFPWVTLHDMFGLEEQVRDNRDRRKGEIPKVDAIIERELCELGAWAHHQAMRPLLAELYGHAEAIRRSELEQATAEGAIDAATLDRVTRRIVTRLLAAPVGALRDGELGLDQRHADYLRRMFGLGRDSAHAERHGMTNHAGAVSPCPAQPLAEPSQADYLWVSDAGGQGASGVQGPDSASGQSPGPKGSHGVGPATGHTPGPRNDRWEGGVP